MFAWLPFHYYMILAHGPVEESNYQLTKNMYSQSMPRGEEYPEIIKQVLFSCVPLFSFMCCSTTMLQLLPLHFNMITLRLLLLHLTT